MPGSWPQHELPNLTDDTCKVTSARTNRYNCIAWAAGNQTRNWWPDPWGIGYWPPSVPRVVSMEVFIEAFSTLGYELCYDNSLEAGMEKVALYGTENSDGNIIPTHAALQLESGEWSSKLGPFEDVSHNTLEDANGPVYGKTRYFMRRPRG